MNQCNVIIENENPFRGDSGSNRLKSPELDACGPSRYAASYESVVLLVGIERKLPFFVQKAITDGHRTKKQSKHLQWLAFWQLKAFSPRAHQTPNGTARLGNSFPIGFLLFSENSIDSSFAFRWRRFPTTMKLVGFCGLGPDGCTKPRFS